VNQKEIDVLIIKVIGVVDSILYPQTIVVKVIGNRVIYDPIQGHPGPVNPNGNHVMVMNSQTFNRQIKVQEISSLWIEQNQTMIQVNNEVLIVGQELKYIMDEIGWKDK
jgi:hypothetical protein